MRAIDADHLKRWILSRVFKTQLSVADVVDQIDREDTIEPERKKGADNGCPFLTCKHGGFGDDACSKCSWAYRDMYEQDEEGAQDG